MDLLLIFFIGVLAVGIVGAILSNIPQKNSNGEQFEKFISGNEFGAISKDRVVTAVLKNDALFIHDTRDKETNVTLKYDKITNVRLTSSTEIMEKSKSVAGRAVLGGLVLGPIGAILGGASGIGNKVEKDVKNYILISYISSDDDTKAIMLEVSPMNAWLKFFDALKIKANINEETSIEL